MSKRFAMERFLGLTEEEITKNERMWREEHNKDQDNDPVGKDLRSVGVSAGDMEADLQTMDDIENQSPEGEEGMETAGPVGDAATGGVEGGTPAPAGNQM